MPQPISSIVHRTQPFAATDSKPADRPAEFIRAPIDGDNFLSRALRKLGGGIGHSTPSLSPERKKINKDIWLVQTKFEDFLANNPGRRTPNYFAHSGANGDMGKLGVGGGFYLRGRTECRPDADELTVCCRYGKITTAYIKNTKRVPTDAEIQSLITSANFSLSRPNLLSPWPWQNAPFK